MISAPSSPPPNTPPLRVGGAGDEKPEPIAVDIRTAAHMLQISQKQVRRAIKNGDLRYFRPARGIRIRIVELNAYIARLERQQNGVAMPERKDNGEFVKGKSTPLFPEQR